VSIEINLKQAIVKLSNPTEEIRMLCEQRQQMKITKCRQDRQGRVFITVEFENRRILQSAKKKSVKRKKTKRKMSKSRKTNVRTRKTKPKKTGFNKLLGEIL
jgi:chromosomal replication initiation ATPase DnaA